ncbi:MAG: hypothetical protein WKF67_01325 [Rubrobacteraceae bacterium]
MLGQEISIRQGEGSRILARPSPSAVEFGGHVVFVEAREERID